MNELKDINPIKTIIISTAVLLVIPFLIRLLTAQGYPLGYHSFEIMTDISQEGLVGIDSATVLSQPWIFDGSSFVYGLASVAGIRASLLLIPLLSGLLSVILIYLILRNMKIEKTLRFITLMVFIASPTFFYTFGTATTAAVAFLLVALGIYVFNKSRPIFFYSSLIIFLYLPFIGLLYYLISLVPLTYMTAKQRSRKGMFIIISSLLIASLWYGYLFLNLGLPKLPALAASPLLAYFVSDLSGTIGFGVFTLFLCVSGLFLTWKKKREHTPFYLGGIIIFVLSLVSADALIFLSVPISLFAASAIQQLFHRRWHLSFIRDISLLLVVCGIVFSTISFSTGLIRQGPTIEEIGSLVWADRNIPPGAILSHPKAGSLIHAVSGRKIIAGGKQTLYTENGATNVTDTIFRSRNLKATSEILDEYHISAIWIPSWLEDQMRKENKDGLLFLFRNNETFKNAKLGTSIGIWIFEQRDDQI